MKSKQKQTKRRSLDPNTVVLIRHIVTGVVIIGAVGMLLSAVWYGARLSALTISEVEVVGGETIDHTIIESLVREQLTDEYIGFIPKQFTLLYPKESIVDTVEAIDRVHNVAVHRERGTKLRVSFDEYVPEALWCETIESDSCLFLDASGYAFAPAPSLRGGRFLRFIEIGQSPVLHQQITEQAQIDAAVLLVELLAEQGWHVSYVEVGQEGDVFLLLVDGGELKVDLAMLPVDTVENLMVILGSDEFSHLEPGNFQYIDLRFGNKVFVNEEPAVPEGETASSTASSSEESLSN